MLYKNERIERSLLEMGFEDFTEIQKRTIPLIEEGKDVIGHSQTGTGKTAAFTLPILNDLDFESKDIQAIVLCPTRELAVQVKSEIDKIGKYLPQLKTTSVYGGEPISKQIYQLKRKPQVIVGTPGRTIDLINRKLIRLGKIKFLVLDEADEMLKMGFIEDIETIIEASNDDRQTTMFSATMPKPIIHLSKKYMTNHEVVSVVSGDETNKDITQYYYNVSGKNKVEAVARLLHVYNPQLSLVFCNTKRKVDDVTRELTKKGYNVDKIHGDLQQTARLHVLDKFHKGVLDILVATDVAARGLDIKNVEVVFNFDVPEKADYYTHRIGRTGRIGNKGYAFTLVSRSEMGRLDTILRFTKSTIKKRNVPTPEKVLRVRQDKQLEDLNELMKTENVNAYYELASKLLEDNEASHVVSALLSKLEKKDHSEVIRGDINEDVSRRSSGSRGSRGSKGGDVTRFHINLGQGVGMNPKKLADLVQAKSGLNNRDIKDITIRHAFSFFSVSRKNEKVVMKKLANITFNGKTSSLQIAKERKR